VCVRRRGLRRGRLGRARRQALRRRPKPTPPSATSERQRAPAIVGTPLDDEDRARSLGADYQPHFILVDANGDSVDTWEGGGDAEVWSGMLARLP
jgi:hypothetical protein